MTKKFTKTVSAMAVVFATMISSNVIVSAAEVSNAGSDTVKVIVDGKQVGLVHTDLTDFDSGINFIEDGGKFSKEFDTVEDLFTFLIQKYTKRGANK